MAFEVFNVRQEMWKYQRSRAKTERNEAILADRNTGLSYAKLGKKWGLSTMTVFHICRRTTERRS